MISDIFGPWSLCSATPHHLSEAMSLKIRGGQQEKLRFFPAHLHNIQWAAECGERVSGVSHPGTNGISGCSHTIEIQEWTSCVQRNPIHDERPILIAFWPHHSASRTFWYGRRSGYTQAEIINENFHSCSMFMSRKKFGKIWPVFVRLCPYIVLSRC